MFNWTTLQHGIRKVLRFSWIQHFVCFGCSLLVVVVASVRIMYFLSIETYWIDIIDRYRCTSKTFKNISWFVCVSICLCERKWTLGSTKKCIYRAAIVVNYIINTIEGDIKRKSTAEELLISPEFSAVSHKRIWHSFI